MIFTDFAPNEGFDDVLVALKTLLKPHRWKKGKELARVKARLRAFFPDHQPFLFLSARCGIYQTLQGLNLPTGSEVVVQGFTCEAVVLPILALNLTPTYVDIEDVTFSMNAKDLEDKLTDDTKILILQHTYGLVPRDRDEILSFAKKRKIVVIEDLAHGFGKEFFKKDKASTIKLLSFGRTKAYSSVWGGAVLSNQKILSQNLGVAEKRLSHPSYGSIWDMLWYKPLMWLSKATYRFYVGKFLHAILRIFSPAASEITPKEKRGQFDNTINKAYPNALAMLLLQQLKKFEQISEIRAQYTKMYHGIISQKYTDNRTSVDSSNPSLIWYPFLIDDPKKLIKTAKKKKILLARRFDQVVAPKIINLSQMKYTLGTCPVAEKVSERIVNLPTLITDKQASKVVSLL